MKNNQSALERLIGMIKIVDGKVSVSTEEEINNIEEVKKDDKAQLAKRITEFMANDEDNEYRHMSYYTKGVSQSEYTDAKTVEYNIKINTEDKKKDMDK